MTNAIETVIFSIAVEQETDEDWGRATYTQECKKWQRERQRQTDDTQLVLSLFVAFFIEEREVQSYGKSDCLLKM